MNTEEIATEIETCEHGVSELSETSCTECEELGEFDSLDENGKLVIADGYWTSPSYLAYCAKHGLRPGRPSAI